MALKPGLRLSRVCWVAGACDVVEAAASVISEVMMSDIVTVTVGGVTSSDTVTIKVVVCSSSIVGAEA
jgi:hypothetical protein